MSWSTRQLAELAGTTVKTVRHYHAVGLLDEPERGLNGYKHYRVQHLVQLLRIKRLADLGVPLSDVPAVVEGRDPQRSLRLLDAELAETVERLQRVRAELALILAHETPVDVPAGFSDVAAHLSSADRALLLVYSRVLAPPDLQALHRLLLESGRSAVDDELDALPADADEPTRRGVAERFAPRLSRLREQHPWLEEFRLRALQDGSSSGAVIGQALADLLNPAQLDVLRQAHALTRQSRDDDGTVTEARG